MPISITSASVAEELCILEDLPSTVRGTNNANDPELANLILRSSWAIMRFCGIYFPQRTYQEDVAGYGTTILQLLRTKTTEGLYPSGPITTVSSVAKLDTEDGSNPSSITTYQIHDAMAGQLYRRVGWEWTGQINTDLADYVSPDSERPLFRVTYISGYTTPRFGTISTTVEGTLPYDIRQAAIDTVVQWYHREQRDSTVIRRRMGDVELQYADPKAGNPLGLAPSAMALLEPWVRWA